MKSQKAACHKVNSALISLFIFTTSVQISDAQGILLATNDFGSPLISLINSSPRSKQNSLLYKNICVAWCCRQNVNKSLMLLGMSRVYWISLFINTAMAEINHFSFTFDSCYCTREK